MDRKEAVKAGVIAGCIVLFILFFIIWAAARFGKRRTRYEYTVVMPSVDSMPMSCPMETSAY